MDGRCRVSRSFQRALPRMGNLLLPISAETPAPEVRDNRLIDLSLVLLCDPLPGDDLKHETEQTRRLIQISTLRFRGWAYSLRGNNARAVDSIREAIAMIQELKPTPGEDEKKFAEGVSRRLDDFKEIL